MTKVFAATVSPSGDLKESNIENSSTFDSVAKNWTKSDWKRNKVFLTEVKVSWEDESSGQTGGDQAVKNSRNLIVNFKKKEEEDSHLLWILSYLDKENEEGPKLSPNERSFIESYLKENYGIISSISQVNVYNGQDIGMIGVYEIDSGQLDYSHKSWNCSIL